MNATRRQASDEYNVELRNPSVARHLHLTVVLRIIDSK